MRSLQDWVKRLNKKKSKLYIEKEKQNHLTFWILIIFLHYFHLAVGGVLEVQLDDWWWGSKVDWDLKRGLKIMESKTTLGDISSHCFNKILLWIKLRSIWLFQGRYITDCNKSTWYINNVNIRYIIIFNCFCSHYPWKCLMEWDGLYQDSLQICVSAPIYDFGFLLIYHISTFKEKKVSKLENRISNEFNAFLESRILKIQRYI